MENPIKMDDLGVLLFLETPIWTYFNQSHQSHVTPLQPASGTMILTILTHVGVVPSAIGGMWLSIEASSCGPLLKYYDNMSIKILPGMDNNQNEWDVLCLSWMNKFLYQLISHNIPSIHQLTVFNNPKWCRIVVAGSAVHAETFGTGAIYRTSYGRVCKKITELLTQLLLRLSRHETVILSKSKWGHHVPFHLLGGFSFYFLNLKLFPVIFSRWSIL